MARYAHRGWGLWRRVTRMVVVPAALVVGLTMAQPAISNGPSARADTVAGVGPVDFECKVTAGDAVTGRNDACPAWEGAFHTGSDQYAPTTEFMEYNAPSWRSDKPGNAPAPSAMSLDGRFYFQAIEHSVYGDGYDYKTRRIPGVVAFDATNGSVVWSADYLGTETSPQGVITGLAVSPDGRGVYAAGEMFSPQLDDYQAVVVAFDASTGDLLWDRYPLTGNGVATDIAVSADSAHVAFTGYRDEIEMVTAMFDAATGQHLWKATVTRPSGQLGSRGARIVAASEVATEPGQPAFYAAGVDLHLCGGFCAGNILTFAYGPTGELLWSHQKDRPGHRNPGPDYLILTPDGKRLLYSQDPFGGSGNPEIVAIDTSNGNELWSSSTDQYLAPSGLAMDPGGERVYLSGWRNEGWDTEVTDDPTAEGQSTHTVAFRVSDGAQLWSVRLNDRQLTDVPRVAVNPAKSQVHVVARDIECCVRAIGGQNWVLVATYDSATGELISLSRYGDWTQQHIVAHPLLNLRAHEPWALAVTPDGSHIISAMTTQELFHPTTSPDPGINILSWTTVVAYQTPQ